MITIKAVLASILMSSKVFGFNVLTTNDGQPIDNNQNLLTVGQEGPALLQDFQFIEKMAHFDRERIPERVVHARGSGAYGHFEVTKDITHLTTANLLNKVGKKTPVFVRFSTVGQESGSSDTVRDPRGFAVKFYTEEGNWDLVGNNLPVFFIRDAVKFPDFVHTQKRHPQTGAPDPDMFWDFLSLTPESVNMVTYLFSDLALPDGYPHMNGFGVHAYKLIDSKGNWNYVKWHWVSEQGVRNLTASQASIYAGSDKDRDRLGLFRTIRDNKFPSWKLMAQVMTPQQAQRMGPSVVDATKLWSTTEFPLQEVGRMTLTRNPKNFFAETEQAAFCPSHIVRGFDFSEDKLLLGRIFSYADTHRHRLGPNYLQIPINRPNSTVHNHQRDGAMTINGNYGSEPNYEPNSVDPNSPKEIGTSNVAKTYYRGSINRFKRKVTDDDYKQAGELYRSFDKGQKDRLIEAIVGNLKDAKKSIRDRQIRIFFKADKHYGQRVQDGVNNALGMGYPV